MLNKLEYTIGLGFLGILSLISFHNYLMFHVLVELFSVIIAFGIASLVWHGRFFINNGSYIVIGLAYIFIGIFELLHTISYKNMNILSYGGSNLPTQLWIAARYFESISFLIAPFFIDKKNFTLISIIYSIVFVVVLLNILWLEYFPICYIEGVGLTNFKIFSEYIICLIFIASLAHIVYRKNHFDTQTVRWIIISIATSIIAEIFFTLYINVYDLANVFGHYFMFISYYCIYKAFIETSFTRPYNTLFNKLQTSEELFRTYFNLPLMGRAIISWEKQKWIQVNEKLLELLGYAKEDLDKNTWTSLTHPDDWRLEKQKFALIEKNRIDYFSCEKRFIRGDNSILEAEISLACIRHKNEMPDYFVVIVADISQRKSVQREKEHLISDLKEAIRDIKILQTFLPICPSCHKIKDADGYWHLVENYINEYTPMKTEYTFCDECLKRDYPELLEARRTISQYHDYLDKLNSSKK
jgi:PAS domain S-box-containing protein